MTVKMGLLTLNEAEWARLEETGSGQLERRCHWSGPGLEAGSG